MGRQKITEYGPSINSKRYYKGTEIHIIGGSIDMSTSNDVIGGPHTVSAGRGSRSERSRLRLSRFHDIVGAGRVKGEVREVLISRQGDLQR